MSNVPDTTTTSTVQQCVILLGGLGTRLGDLTKAVPKPLLPVDGRPFVEVLIAEASRRGFTKLLLLAGHRSQIVLDYVRNENVADRFGVEIEVLIEVEPLGTGGALVNALTKLDEHFVLLNGDTWFDFNWMDLVHRSIQAGAHAALALRTIVDPDRYETIALDGSHVAQLRPRRAIVGEALINGGVYYLTRRAIAGLGMPSSLETDLLPMMVDKARLHAFTYSGFFIDIGLPSTYDEAQTTVPAQRRRPAVFLDRDGVLNRDFGYVHSVEQLSWMDGAKEAIKLLNDKGYYVFVVTNQAGVARGFYDEARVRAFHAEMGGILRNMGAYVDDWRYCPFHPEGTVEAYRRPHPWRKPEPGMLIDLLEHWPVKVESSFLIGDQDTDIAAARAAGIPGHLFNGSDLLHLVQVLLQHPSRHN